MRQIRKIPYKDYDTFAEIVINAYPGIFEKTADMLKQAKERLIKGQKVDPNIKTIGVYQDKTMAGIMRMYDYIMNWHNIMIPVGGVGLVAVDLRHKKEKVCKDLITYFLRYYYKHGYCMTALYPFRPDFYRKMGFGYSTKHCRYSIKPGDLPCGNSKEHIVFLKKKDRQAVIDCYNRFASSTHGMMRKTAYETLRFDRSGLIIAGYKEGRKVPGYVAFTFEKESREGFLINNISIAEMVYENRDVFAELMTFLHTQADQVHRIIYDTQDEAFHFVPFDPRNGTNNFINPVGHESNTQGVGLMYRLINIPEFFGQLEQHDFGRQSLNVKFNIRDSFMPENQGDYFIQFENGRSSMSQTKKYDVEICLDIAEFSSMVMGAIDFETLYQYNLAEISNTKYLSAVNDLFYSKRKPICMSSF